MTAYAAAALRLAPAGQRKSFSFRLLGLAAGAGRPGPVGLVAQAGAEILEQKVPDEIQRQNQDHR